MWFYFLKGEKKRPCQRGLARSYNKLDRSDQSWPEPDPATSSTQQLPKSNKLQIKINLRSKNHTKKTKQKNNINAKTVPSTSSNCCRFCLSRSLRLLTVSMAAACLSFSSETDDDMFYQSIELTRKKKKKRVDKI